MTHPNPNKPQTQRSGACVGRTPGPRPAPWPAGEWFGSQTQRAGAFRGSDALARRLDTRVEARPQEHLT
jgi:hypothetical protein